MQRNRGLLMVVGRPAGVIHQIVNLCVGLPPKSRAWKLLSPSPTSIMGWFYRWFGSPWYAMLYKHRDEEDAAGLVASVIAKGGLRPGDKLLDLACGRGRHAAVFAKAGLDVTGVDISVQSIKDAKAQVPGVHFEVHDMREPFARDQFDAVVCLFTSLGYTGDRNDDRRAVSAAAQALKPGGLFVLDLMNGDVVTRDLVPEEVRHIEGMRFVVNRTVENGEVVKRILVEHPEGEHRFEERVHAWRLPEVEALIEGAGLRLKEVTDSTCANTFHPEHSNRIVAWARKQA